MSVTVTRRPISSYASVVVRTSAPEPCTTEAKRPCASYVCVIGCMPGISSSTGRRCSSIVMRVCACRTARCPAPSRRLRTFVPRIRRLIVIGVGQAFEAQRIAGLSERSPAETSSAAFFPRALCSTCSPGSETWAAEARVRLRGDLHHGAIGYSIFRVHRRRSFRAVSSPQPHWCRRTSPPSARRSTVQVLPSDAADIPVTWKPSAVSLRSYSLKPPAGSESFVNLPSSSYVNRKTLPAASCTLPANLRWNKRTSRPTHPVPESMPGILHRGGSSVAFAPHRDQNGQTMAHTPHRIVAATLDGRCISETVFNRGQSTLPIVAKAVYARFRQRAARFQVLTRPR